MRILVLCNKSPYPAKEGGPIAINMIVEGLTEAGHSVKVLAMNTDKYSVRLSDIPEEYRIKTGIELIYVDLRFRPLKAFMNLFTNESYHVERFVSAQFAKRLEEILLLENFDVVQFEMPFLSPYLPIVKKNSNARTILRTHNIEHKIWERIAATTKNPVKKLYLRHLARTLKMHELRVIREFDGIAAISEVDAEYFRHSLLTSGPSSLLSDQLPEAPHPFLEGAGIGNGGDRVVTIPFGIDPSKYKMSQNPRGTISLFSIGAMNWIPNAEGIRWFLENVWNGVSEKYPELKYYIAGREMPDWLTRSDFPNAVIVGEVEDAQLFMEDHSLMIVPLFSGSGIRIKIIEGMAAGKAILSTSIGAEGIHYTHGENILVADSPGDFIRMISACIEDQHLISKLGKNARLLIESEYNRETIIQNLFRFYQKTGS